MLLTWFWEGVLQVFIDTDDLIDYIILALDIKEIVQYTLSSLMNNHKTHLHNFKKGIQSCALLFSI